MHLMYITDANGTSAGRRYTLKKVLDGQVTKSAHPARFSPDDKWSRHRLAVRKRFAVLFAQHQAKDKAQAQAVLDKKLLEAAEMGAAGAHRAKARDRRRKAHQPRRRH
ncbi:hypothetical protein VTJ49DRAFT_2662 [Mycothermus thermophilus]|uniref:H/ACA ribonucleoprotein complex subunit NOP10 n=1 Tax=Humicola insolens TaxID=85995 RepID=A0ABR3V9C4_HUMIN